MTINEINEAVKRHDIEMLLLNFQAVTYKPGGCFLVGLIKKNCGLHARIKHDYDIAVEGETGTNFTKIFHDQGEPYQTITILLKSVR